MSGYWAAKVGSILNSRTPKTFKSPFHLDWNYLDVW
jgi:hypothetical protein